MWCSCDTPAAAAAAARLGSLDCHCHPHHHPYSLSLTSSHQHHRHHHHTTTSTTNTFNQKILHLPPLPPCSFILSYVSKEKCKTQTYNMTNLPGPSMHCLERGGGSDETRSARECYMRPKTGNTRLRFRTNNRSKARATA